MKIKRVKKPILELFYVRMDMERYKFTSEMENQLNILIEKEKENQLSEKFNLIGDFIVQKKEKPS